MRRYCGYATAQASAQLDTTLSRQRTWRWFRWHGCRMSSSRGREFFWLCGTRSSYYWLLDVAVSFATNDWWIDWFRTTVTLKPTIHQGIGRSITGGSYLLVYPAGILEKEGNLQESDLRVPLANPHKIFGYTRTLTPVLCCLGIVRDWFGTYYLQAGWTPLPEALTPPVTFRYYYHNSIITQRAIPAGNDAIAKKLATFCGTKKKVKSMHITVLRRKLQYK